MNFLCCHKCDYPNKVGPVIQDYLICLPSNERNGVDTPHVTVMEQEVNGIPLRRNIRSSIWAKQVSHKFENHQELFKGPIYRTIFMIIGVKI